MRSLTSIVLLVALVISQLTLPLTAMSSWTSQSIFNSELTDEQEHLKGVWVTTVFNLDYPSKATVNVEQLKQDADRILDHIQALDLNTVFFQVRPSGDAFYQSKQFPWSEFLTGTQGLAPENAFDPLQYWIDGAHSRGLKIHAWLNPYRVTTTAAKAGIDPYSVLSQNNPARLNPNWTVVHKDGKIYYNPGLPEVRNMLIAEIVDLVSRYAVDGIHFDDYFYPDANFDDAKSFAQYGQGKKLEDWRRDNVTLLVRDAKQAIKAVKPNVLFGISPFGIWGNAKDIDGGSDTAGNQSYSSHYADTKKWVESEYLDYIMPQIYWHIGYEIADYAKLVRWWHDLTLNTSVDLYIGMAAYRSGNSDAKSPWFGDEEIIRQLRLNSVYPKISGEVFYRYAFLKSRPTLAANIQNYYREAGTSQTDEPNQKMIELKVTGPGKDITTTHTQYYISGISDPNFPLYMNDELVLNRSSNGYFGVYVDVPKGKNSYVFTQGDQVLTRIIARGVALSTSSSSTNVSNNTATAKPILPDLGAASLYPQKSVMWPEGEKITLTATAPVGAVVTAEIGGKVITLIPKDKSPAGTRVVNTTYSEVFTMPNVPQGQRDLEYGNVIYRMRYKSKDYKRVSPGKITLLSNQTQYWAEIKADTTDTYPYKETSKGAAHFLSKGMMDQVTANNGSMVRLASGYWVKTADINLVKRTAPFVLNTLQYKAENRLDTLSLKFSGNSATFTRVSGSKVLVDMGTIESKFDFSTLVLPSNSLASKVTTRVVEGRTLLEITLKSGVTLGGHWVERDSKGVHVYLKRAFQITNDTLPLEGLKVLLDPGHGGKDPGAISFLGSDYGEKQINLILALMLRDQLKALGAQVHMTRDSDVDMTLQQRLRLSYQYKPDLFLSIHANSIGPEANIGNIFGFSSHYLDPVAKIPALSIVQTVTDDLNRKSRGAKVDRFYVVRGTWASSVLIETGFIPNPLEFDWLTDAKMQEDLATALTNAIIKAYK